MRLLPLYVRLALGEFAGAFRVGADGRTLHAYSFQTFNVGQVLTATQMNQVEVNIRDHVHGVAGVNALARFATFAASGSFTCPLTGNFLVIRKGAGGGGGGGGRGGGVGGAAAGSGLGGLGGGNATGHGGGGGGGGCGSGGSNSGGTGGTGAGGYVWIFY